MFSVAPPLFLIIAMSRRMMLYCMSTSGYRKEPCSIAVSCSPWRNGCSVYYQCAVKYCSYRKSIVTKLIHFLRGATSFLYNRHVQKNDVLLYFNKWLWKRAVFYSCFVFSVAQWLFLIQVYMPSTSHKESSCSPWRHLCSL
jgi:hypothetical protein